MDIRTKTGLVIRKDGEYLVGRIPYSQELRWSRSPWDAWRTRNRENAKKVAERVKGQQVLFNPVSGQLAEVTRE